MLNTILYCPICSNQLAPTGSYIQETYYICPCCNTEYTAIIKDEANITIEAELKEDNPIV